MKLRVTELADEKEFADELARVQPAEVLVSEEQAAQFRDLRGLVARDKLPCWREEAFITAFVLDQIAS